MANFFFSMTFNNGAVTDAKLKALEATDLPASGVTPGTYTLATVTVDTFGRVTAASNGSVGTVAVTSFNTRKGAVTLTSADVTTALGFSDFARLGQPNTFTAGETFEQGFGVGAGGFAGQVATDGAATFLSLTITGGTGSILLNSDGSFAIAGGAFTVDTTGNMNAQRVTVIDAVTANAGLGTSVSLNGDGTITPGSLADGDAPDSTIYYSTTASKLVYKDSGGTVHNLY